MSIARGREPSSVKGWEVCTSDTKVRVAKEPVSSKAVVVLLQGPAGRTSHEFTCVTRKDHAGKGERSQQGAETPSPQSNEAPATSVTSRCVM